MNRGLHGNATIVLSSLVAVIGIAIVVRTIAAGGSAVAQGVLIGLLFAAAGAGRAWMAWKSSSLLPPPDDAGEERSDARR